MEAALIGSAMGLLDCPVCPSFKEFRGIRPGRIDLFSETGLSWNTKRKTAFVLKSTKHLSLCAVDRFANKRRRGSEVYSSHSDDQLKCASPY